MDSNDWLRLKQIFNTVLDRKPEERSSFIEKACRDEPELRREIEDLLASHEESKHFMELPSSGGFLQEVEVEHMASTRVGQYLLKQVISSGGMGTVYAGTYTPNDTPVAVKVLDPVKALKDLHRDRFHPGFDGGRGRLFAKQAHPLPEPAWDLHRPG